MAPSRNKNSDKNKMAPASSSITESDSAGATAEAPTLRPRRAIVVYNERQLQARANEERRLSRGVGSANSSSTCILPTDFSSESANDVEGRTSRKRCSSTSEDSFRNSKRLRQKLGKTEEESKERMDDKSSLPRRSTRSTTSACVLQSEKKPAKTIDKIEDKASSKSSKVDSFATSNVLTSSFSIAQLTRSNKTTKKEPFDTTSTSSIASTSAKKTTSATSCSSNKKGSANATAASAIQNSAVNIYDSTVESVIETLRKHSRSPSSSAFSSNAASSRNTPQPSFSCVYNVPPSTTVAEALGYQSGGSSYSIFSDSPSAGRANSQLIQSILQSATASAALATGDESIIPSSSTINATISSVLDSMRTSRLRREVNASASARYSMGGGGRRRTKGPNTLLYTASIPALNVTDAELFRPSWAMPNSAVVSRVTADIMQLGRAIFHDSSWARIKFPERSLFGQEAIVYHYRSIRWSNRHMMFVPYGKPRITEDIPYTCSDCFKFMQCLKHRFTEAQQRNKIPVLIIRYGRFLDNPDFPEVKHICDPDELTDMEKEALREYGESLRACSTGQLPSERKEEKDVVVSAINSNSDRNSSRKSEGLKVVVPVNRTSIPPFLADVVRVDDVRVSIKQFLAKQMDATAQLTTKYDGCSVGDHRQRIISSAEESKLLSTFLKSNWHSAWSLFAGSLSGKRVEKPLSVSYKIGRPAVKPRTKSSKKVTTLVKTVPKTKSVGLKSLTTKPTNEKKFVINIERTAVTKKEKDLRTNVPILKRKIKEFQNQQQLSGSASSPSTGEKSETEYRRLLLTLEAQLTACCAKMINAGLDFTHDTLRMKSGEFSEDLGIPASRISDEWLMMIGRRLGVSTFFASGLLRDDRFVSLASASSAMETATDEVDEEEVGNKTWNANDYLLNIISAAMGSSLSDGAEVDDSAITTDGGVKTELTDATSILEEEQAAQLLKATTNEGAHVFKGNNGDDASVSPADDRCSPSTSGAVVASGSMESVSVLVSESALPIQLFTSTPPIVEDGVIASGSGEEILQRMEAARAESGGESITSSLRREIKREVLDEEFVVSRADPSFNTGDNNAPLTATDCSTLNQPSTSTAASTTTEASTTHRCVSTAVASSVSISSPTTMHSVYDLIVSAAAAASKANKLAMKGRKPINSVAGGGRRKSLTLSSPSSPSLLTLKKQTGNVANDADKCKSLSPPLTVVCDTATCASQPLSSRSSPALTLANGVVGKRDKACVNGTVHSSNGGVSASIMALLMNGGYADGCTEQLQNGHEAVNRTNTKLTAENNNNNTKNTLLSMLQSNFTNFNHPEVAIALETIRRHIETRDHSLMPMFNTFSARITKMMYTTLPKTAQPTDNNCYDAIASDYRAADRNGVGSDDRMLQKKNDGGEGNALIV